MSLRLGVDVGGTNTDAVILDEHARVLGRFKSPTTPDVTSGIRNALDGLLSTTPGLDVRHIRYAMLGTTHCTNALLERRNLNRVGLIRIGAAASAAIPPYTDWPEDLRAAIGGRFALVAGGYDYDGREIQSLDQDGVRAAANAFKAEVESVAIVGVFSAVDTSHEERAAGLVHDILGDVPITYSHEIGSLGLLERENASILNAALVDVARAAAHAFEKALAAHGIQARLFFSQNDGTLMALEYAARYPILTVASGPANSIRGAAFLSGQQDAIVVDVGGTSTDVGILSHGFPRESAVTVDIAGVRTNFRMPDLLSIALGGGTIVHLDPRLHIGPDSVGYRINASALVFGGDTLTLSDVAVAAGVANIGGAQCVAELDPDIVTAVMTEVRARYADAIDRVKTSPAPLPVVLVGGGSIIIPDDASSESVVHRPEHYDVANAIGAAIAQCSGEVERVFSLESRTREQALAIAQDMARSAAVAAGADASSVQIIDVHEVPLSYLPGNATRIRVRAAGDLAGG